MKTRKVMIFGYLSQADETDVQESFLFVVPFYVLILLFINTLQNYQLNMRIELILH